MSIKLTRIVQTCWGCPSQWDGWDADGNQYYLRYRWGGGRVDRVSEGGSSETVATFSHGGALDGVLDLETFARLAGLDVHTAEQAPQCFDHGYTHCTICDPTLSTSGEVKP